VNSFTQLFFNENLWVKFLTAMLAGVYRGMNLHNQNTVQGSLDVINYTAAKMANLKFKK
jgi:hypothetical protein